MVSNIESVAREIGEQVPEVATLQEKAEQVLNSDVAVANPQASKAVELVTPDEATQALESNQETEVAVADTTKQDNKVYDVTEVMPQFPGAPGDMLKFFKNNIKYPKSAYEAKKQGTVIVNFIVGKDGNISDAKVMKSVDPDLDAEAVRVVNSMPKWSPGKQNGEAVDVKYTVPVIFRLSGDGKKVDSEKFFKEQASTASKFVDANYPGGSKAFSKFFAENVRYPVKAQKAGIAKFRTRMMFIVNADGSLSFPPADLPTSKMPRTVVCTDPIMVVGYKYQADKSVTEKEAEKLLDEEVAKLARKMPRWKKTDKQIFVSVPIVFVEQ